MKRLALAFIAAAALAIPAGAQGAERCRSSIGGLTWNGHHIRARYRSCWTGRPYADGSRFTVTITTPDGPITFEYRWPL